MDYGVRVATERRMYIRHEEMDECLTPRNVPFVVLFDFLAEIHRLAV
jgi:hypothetical protein